MARRRVSAQNPKLDFPGFLAFLRDSRGMDLSGYRPSTLERRIAKRMWEVGAADFDAYRDILLVQPDEFEQLFNTVLINVTTFFRDPVAWETLAKEGIPQIIAEKEESESIRVWSIGCSSGEEAYTVAMLLAEALPPRQFQRRVKIYATDVDEDALHEARQATFPTARMKSVPGALRKKYFDQSGSRYVVKPELRRAIVFGRHDILRDAPISHIDLAICRNLLIYFNKDTQRGVLARIHFGLRDDGILFLGKAEMLLLSPVLFRPLSLKHRLFVKEAAPIDASVLPLPSADTGINPVRLGSALRESTFSGSPIAQVVVDPKGDLVMANDLARSTFGLSSRDLNRPFKDIELSFRPVDLRAALQEATKNRRTVHVADAKLASAAGIRYLDVHVAPLLDAADSLTGLSVTFEDVTPRVSLQEELVRSREALETAYEELQASNEELETTNEELQSANEELETTNEELQSANEELETMNEELQSTNEELGSTNASLRERSDEVRRGNQFLQSVLSSLQQATVVVDNDLRVLLWNSTAQELWGLRSDEVLGQFFPALDIGLPTAELQRPIKSVLSGQQQSATPELDAINRRGRPLRCRVNIRQLHGDAQAIEGAIMLIGEMSST